MAPWSAGEGWARPPPHAQRQRKHTKHLPPPVDATASPVGLRRRVGHTPSMNTTILIIWLLGYAAAVSAVSAPALIAASGPSVSPWACVSLVVLCALVPTIASVSMSFMLARRAHRAAPFDNFFDGDGVFLETLQMPETGCEDPFAAAKRDIEVCLSSLLVGETR